MTRRSTRCAVLQEGCKLPLERLGCTIAPALGYQTVDRSKSLFAPSNLSMSRKRPSGKWVAPLTSGIAARTGGVLYDAATGFAEGVTQALALLKTNERVGLATRT